MALLLLQVHSCCSTIGISLLLLQRLMILTVPFTSESFPAMTLQFNPGLEPALAFATWWVAGCSAFDTFYICQEMTFQAASEACIQEHKSDLCSV